jgi:hypothetical protein
MPDSNQKPVVTVAKSIAEVESLRPYWQKMQRHPNADIDFYLTIFEARESVLGPYVLTLWRDGAAAMILAGRLEYGPMPFKIGYKAVYQPYVRRLTMIYGGAMGDCSPENCEILIQRVQEALRNENIDVCFFSHLRTDSPIFHLCRNGISFAFRDHFLRSEAHWSITTLDSYDQFVRARSKNTRKNLRKWPKNLASDFGSRLSIKWLHQTDEFDQLMEEMEAIASKTYQRGLGVGFFDNEETRRLTKLGLEKNWLHVCVLYIDNNPIAFWSGSKYGDCYFGDYNGFLPEYASYRPGHYVLVKTIEYLCEDQSIKMMDLGFGDAEYKRELCDVCWNEANVKIFAPHFKGAWLNINSTVTTGIHLFAIWMLSRSKHLFKVKKLWRRRLQDKTHRS